MKPRKGLGQNFLIDKNVQEKIISACNVRKTDMVLEIGPGRGAITGLLLDKARKVMAIEIDRKLCEALAEKFFRNKNFELHNQDILKVDLSKYRRLKVIANIPYYISTPIIAHLFQFRKQIEAIYLTLQKELAWRLTASPGNKDYGAFSCFVQFYSKPSILFPIKRGSFWPRPKVDSAFVKLEILPQPAVKVQDEALFFKIIRLAFNQRRKLLKNSLARIFPEADILAGLKELGLNQNVRAEDLSLSDFAAIADFWQLLTGIDKNDMIKL